MIELGVAERIMMGTMLAPIAADVVTLRIVRKLQEELSFSEQEAEALEFARVDGKVTWKLDVPQTKEFDFQPTAVRIIQEQLKKANASKTLTLQQLDLYDKFCPEEETEQEA
jgi:hypothetical protein